MAETQIFDSADARHNERRARAAQAADPTRTIMYDGAGRWAVGDYPSMGEDLGAYMAPDSWEWLAPEETVSPRRTEHGRVFCPHKCG